MGHFTSVSKRVNVQNLSYENEFRRDTFSSEWFRFRTKALSEREPKCILEMAY